MAPLTNVTCPLDFCDRPSRTGGEPLCEGHYYQRRRGKPFTPLGERRVGGGCAVEGCDKPRTGQWCVMHYRRIKKHGDPEVVLKGGPKVGSNWTENPDYYTFHKRLRKVRGPARDQTCACGGQASQWSYVGPREAGERMPFSTNMDDYEPKCVTCHKNADMQNIRTIERFHHDE